MVGERQTDRSRGDQGVHAGLVWTSKHKHQLELARPYSNKYGVAVWVVVFTTFTTHEIRGCLFNAAYMQNTHTTLTPITTQKDTLVEEEQRRGKGETTLDSRWGIHLCLLLLLSFPLSFTWPPLPRHSRLSHFSLSYPSHPLTLLCLVY